MRVDMARSVTHETQMSITNGDVMVVLHKSANNIKDLNMGFVITLSGIVAVQVLLEL